MLVVLGLQVLNNARLKKRTFREIVQLKYNLLEVFLLQGEIFEERIFTDTINDCKTKFLEDARPTDYSQQSEQ